MGEIRCSISKETEEKFRQAAMKKFGYRKGSLSKAMETALCEWIRTNDPECSDEKAP